jgi:hypothetical protein
MKSTLMVFILVALSVLMSQGYKDRAAAAALLAGAGVIIALRKHEH